MTTLESLKNLSISHPKAFQKRPSPLSPDPISFENTYKNAYSHGLEAIYTLENVDVKSIRRIETSPKPLPKPLEAKKTVPHLFQEELELGDEFRGWIQPFIRKEPIQVLELSKHAEKCLIDHGKNKLGDLIAIQLKDFVFVRGMGQGHIEEIQQKLNSYLEGHSLDRCYKVDFFSLLKGLVAAQDRKKVYALLESYGLADLFSLTPVESIEVRKLTLGKKQEWIQELRASIVKPEQKKSVEADMHQIFNVFIKPWVKRRQGFATQEELQERMQRISVDADICLKVLQFLQDLYFDQQNLFKRFLNEIDLKVFSCGAQHGYDYDKIVDKALSYFYKPTVYYHLNELVGLMEREFAKFWIGFDVGTVEKVLRLSPAFRSIKGSAGHLEIHLS
jgi:hypothetical protein